MFHSCSDEFGDCEFDLWDVERIIEDKKKHLQDTQDNFIELVKNPKTNLEALVWSCQSDEIIIKILTDYLGGGGIVL